MIWLFIVLKALYEQLRNNTLAFALCTNILKEKPQYLTKILQKAMNTDKKSCKTKIIRIDNLVNKQ